ncbi:MAG: glucosaminidase domain-containing protein [Candidatus Sericytochromatia bacterium]|nr:glucosaminidase domain-containing protein [Candidatus Sericytochromatia bacterium]
MTRHIVQRGETLSAIAATYDTSIRRLMRLNRLTDPHRIHAGDTLTLPAEARRPAPDPAQPTPPAKPGTAKRPLSEDRLLLQTERPRHAARQDVDRLARDIEAEKLNPRSPFLRQMVPAALAIEAKYGLPAKVILAQAALESNWGKAAIGTYNVFGIKGRGSQGSVMVSTREHLRGRWVRTREPFARYGSFHEAFEAYARTLHNGRYQRALAVKDNPVRYAKALQGVYATDPGYASKLIAIMKSALGM